MANDINIVVAAQVQGALAPLKQVEQQVSRVGSNIDQATNQLRRHSSQYNATAVSANRFAKGALQQLGYQIGDYAVQVANGTSKMQAFGQQGSQMLGIFGPIGAVLGAGVAIFSAYAVAAERAGGSVSTLSDRQDRLNSIMADYVRVSEIARMEAADLAAKYGDLGDEVRDAANNLMYLREIQAAAVLREQISGLDDIVDQFGGTVTGIGTPLDQANRAIREAFGAETSAQVREIGDAFRTLGQATTFEEQTAAIDRIGQMARDLNAGQLPRDLVDALVASEEFKISMAEATYLLETLGESGSTSVRKIKDELSDTEKAVQSLEQSITSNMENAFMSMVDGTKSAKDAFRDMARQIIAELYRVIVVQRTVASITKFLGFGGGGSTEILTKAIGVRAQGGAVSRNQPYIVGEKGPEMLIPSTSGRVIPNNQMSDGGQTINVVQNINISTGVQQTVRTEIKQLMPQIAESAKQAVADAKRRGGSYGRAFA